MIWSPARNFCFIHVPQTDGTAVESAYRPHMRFGDVVLTNWEYSFGLDNWYEETLGVSKYCSAGRLASMLGHERFNMVFSMAVVRDPLERLVSSYNYMKSIACMDATSESISSDISFEYFVESTSERYGDQADLVCFPSTATPMVKLLVPHPHLTTGWNRACARLGINAPLEPSQASADYEAHVTDHARALVAHRYGRDAELYRQAMSRWQALYPEMSVA